MNTYLNNSDHSISSELTKSIASYVYEMLKLFGLQIKPPKKTLEHLSPRIDDSEKSLSSFSMALKPLIDILVTFRADVRRACTSSDVSTDLKSLRKTLLVSCDHLRDQVLPKFSIRLEDQKDGSPLWNLIDKETQEREKLAEASALQQKEKHEQSEKEHRKRAEIPPSAMFRSNPNLYSKFDSQGIPTHNAAGELLSESARKKLRKMFEQQKELHEEFLKSNHQQPSKNNKPHEAPSEVKES